MICSQELQLFDLNDTATVRFLETLVVVSNSYGSIHKYLALVICVVGCLANFVHLGVLTRPLMARNAVNKLLAFVALCDILTMISYTVFTVRFGFAVDLTNPPMGYQLHWIVFLLIHVVCSIALHTITLYTSVATAYVRYKVLKKVSSKWNRGNSAGPIFLVISVCVCALCIPTFLVHDIVRVGTGPSGESLYTVGLSELSTGKTCFIFKANLWLTGIVFKVIPCIMLFTFTIALLCELDINRRRRRLTSGISLASKRIEKKTDRTTLMLVVLMTVFIVTEFPQGVLAILNGLFPNDIHQFVYLSLGEILDLLSLINCNVCFIVYPLMSSVYRHTLKSFFYKAQRIILKKAPIKSLLLESTIVRFVDETDVLL